jgi:hypothetical protein
MDFTPAKLPVGFNTKVDKMAAKENAENKKHVKLSNAGPFVQLLVDSKKVTLHGTPAKFLTDLDKKKLENRLLFMFLGELKQIPVFNYT